MPAANAFNIPDLMRLPLRSWEACALTRSILPASIPHIRAIDVHPDDTLAIGEAVAAVGLSEVLIVKGDAPRDMSRRTYPNTSESIIHRFKREYPDIRVYAAFDPYRSGFRDERDAVRRKIDAGADGFFTQPFFDLRLLEISGEILRNQCVFWGIAPVVGVRSQAYWETTNRVIFPAAFSPTLEWSRSFAVSAVELIRSMKGNVYFMPIKVDLAGYLTGLLPVCGERRQSS
jgi:methylenetetrahydrofolate reductase (NADPH)